MYNYIQQSCKSNFVNIYILINIITNYLYFRKIYLILMILCGNVDIWQLYSQNCLQSLQNGLDVNHRHVILIRQAYFVHIQFVCCVHIISVTSKLILYMFGLSVLYMLFVTNRPIFIYFACLFCTCYVCDLWFVVCVCRLFTGYFQKK